MYYLFGRDYPKCYIKEIVRHNDFRGSLLDIANEPDDTGILKMYYSLTIPTQARDNAQWHQHRHQRDRFVVLQGRCVFALSNGREMVKVILDSEVPQLLSIPPGLYHCFKTIGITSCGLLAFPTKLYNPEDEIRVPFEDLGGVEYPW